MYKLQWNFNKNSNIINQENASENVVWEMDANCLNLNVLRYNTDHTFFNSQKHNF